MMCRIKKISLISFTLASVFLSVVACGKSEKEIPVDQRPLKVFIMMGQSNMVGFGAIGNDTTKGSLAYLTKKEKKYRNLIDPNGNWIERKDVWCAKVTVRPTHGLLKPGYGATGNHFGPELGFGNVIGDYYEEPVLIIKASQGNRSLFWDILPPASTKSVAYGGRVYPGYQGKDSEAAKKGEWYAGKQYDDFITDTRQVLDNIQKYFPEYKNRGYEVAGFAWWQGHKDQYEPAASHYEENMVNLIKCLRKEFNAPKAPFVMATIGFGGWYLGGPGKKVAEAQLAVSGETGKYPEFKDNVKTIESRGFWHESKDSPNKRQDYHYYHNAETYMEVSNAMGKAMVELLSKKDREPVEEKTIKADYKRPEGIYRPEAEYAIYSGSWSKDMDFDRLKPIKTGLITLGKTIEVPAGESFIRIKGFFKATFPGSFAFRPGYRDSEYNMLSINGELLYNRPVGAEEATINRIYLTPGYYPFELIFFKTPRSIPMYCSSAEGERFGGTPANSFWHKEKFTEGMEKSLLSVISNLKAHILGKKTMDEGEMKAAIENLISNNTLFGYNKNIIKASFDLVETYDETMGPLWIKHPEFNRRKLPNDIHYAVYNVMQNIIDEAYTSANISSYRRLFNGFKFQCSDYFPGKVEGKPVRNHTVKINGSYPNTFGPMTMMDELPARKPTGTYLAPGTIATVTVPEALVGKGYAIRVGAHSWDNTRKPMMKRLDRCTVVYNIESTETQVANPLGGGIYIEVPYLADAGIVEVKVKNAVRSPYFSAKSFHKTSLEEWRNYERNLKAPWADFQSDKFMMQVPTSWIYNLDDPATLMAEWDASMDVINNLMGYPEGFGKETMYPQVDLQNRSRVFAPGYPSVNARYKPGEDYGGLSDYHLIRGPQFAQDYEFHEEGHAYFFPKFGGESESTVNFLHVAVWNQLFGYSMDEALRGSRNFTNPYMTIDNTAVTWMTSPNFAANIPMMSAEKAYQLKGHAKYADIARLFGWESLNHFWLSFNIDHENGITNRLTTDLLLERLCDATRADIRPLLHFWGIHPDNPEELQKTIAAKNFRPNRKVYYQIMKYRSLVPEDNEAFQKHAKQWWKREPSPKGFITERGHAAQWNTYDRNSAAKIRKQIDMILKLYFPKGRP